MDGFERSITLGHLAKAKAEAQLKFTPIGKDKTANAGRYSYTYADLATCLDAVIPALSAAGIALFQPVRVAEGKAIATTLLVHESDEFLSGDFAVAIVDPNDAQSIGSATTYARRYGLLSMLGYAAGGEDDDGQAARRGASEPTKVSATLTDNPYTSRRRPPEEAPAPVEANGKGRRPHRRAQPVVLPTEAGSEDCPTVGCWGGRDHPGAHMFDADATALTTMDRGEVVPTTFSIGQGQITTAGMTEAQFLDSLRLATEVDQVHSKGHARRLLQRMLGVPTLEEATRKDLTEAMANHYLAILRQALEVDAP